MQVKRAIIYTRVSSDKGRDARSTTEQEQDCRQEAARQGWPVGAVVTDNDISASRFAAKDRPGFKRLWQILQPGDVLVTWESSRAQRDLRDYLDLRDLCYERGVLLSYNGRTYDLSEGEDRFVQGPVLRFGRDLARLVLIDGLGARSAVIAQPVLPDSQLVAALPEQLGVLLAARFCNGHRVDRCRPDRP